MLKVTSFFSALFLFFISFAGMITDCPNRFSDRVNDPVVNSFNEHPGADPWYYEHDGKYYYCYSLGNGVGVKESGTIDGLYNAEHHDVYRAPSGTEYSQNYWAPELHYVRDAWYIYVAADDGQNENHRMYALKGSSATGPFEFAGKVSAPTDRWSIDGTVLELNDELYFIWSGWDEFEDGNQNLYIAHMSDPLTIDSERVLISKPTLKWEKKGMPINEGPEILKTDKGVFLVYSASGSWTDDYCLGMLRLSGDDPLDPDAWAKCPIAVFTAVDGAYGPGHCSFVTDSVTGKRYIVYHANRESGTGWNGRSVRLQEYITVLGIPVFGKPQV